MAEDQEITDVMFRVSKDDIADVFVLFPALPGTNEPHTCCCYQHVGQHSHANLAGCINSSRPAIPDEYAALKRELEGIGYKLRIVKRRTRKQDEARALAVAG